MHIQIIHIDIVLFRAEEVHVTFATEVLSIGSRFIGECLAELSVSLLRGIISVTGTIEKQCCSSM